VSDGEGWEGASAEDERAAFDLAALRAGAFGLLYFDDHEGVFSVRPGFFASAGAALGWLLFYRLPLLVDEQSAQWSSTREPEVAALRSRGAAAIADGLTLDHVSELCGGFNSLFSRFPRGEVLAWGEPAELLSSEHLTDAFAVDEEDAGHDSEAAASQPLHQLLRDGAFDPARSDHLQQARTFLARHEVYND
jgi:hypothetical protein